MISNLYKYLKKNNYLKKKFLFKFSNLNNERKNLFKNYISKRPQKHKFHLVSPSPWPLTTAFSAFVLVIGLVSWMHKLPQGGFTLLIGFCCVCLSMFIWFRDIIRESIFCGYHTQSVQLNIRYGFTLFIISEIMFFFGFFWSLLHFTLCPSIFSGNIWPPEGIVNFFISQNLNELVFNDKDSMYFLFNSSEFFSKWTYNSNFNFLSSFWYASSADTYFTTFDSNKFFLEAEDTPTTFFLKSFELLPSYYYFLEDLAANETNFFINLYSPGVLVDPLSIPLLNTIILLSSGVFLTYSHISLKMQKFFRAILALALTVIFGIYFFACQLFEYKHSGFSINDGVYGSVFYMLTGFHGFHVFVGTVFLLICLIRFFYQHFTPMNHFGFEAAIWYWHFVDVVWILLFFLIYYWPNIFFFKGSHIILDSNCICLNQPINELNFYFSSVNSLIQNESSLKLNRNLIELILIKNKTELSSVSFSKNFLANSEANITSSKVKSFLDSFNN